MLGQTNIKINEMEIIKKLKEKEKNRDNKKKIEMKKKDNCYMYNCCRIQL